MNNISGLKNKFIIVFLISLVVILASTGLLSLFGAFDRQEKIHFLNTNWTLYADGQFYEDVSPDSLSSLVNRRMNRMDAIHLERDLSDLEGGIQNPSLLLNTYYTTATVYIDGEVIAAIQTDHLKDESFIGCGTYYVELPYDYEAHTLGITFVFGENNSSPNLNVPEIGSYHALMGRYLREHALALSFATFMIVFGLIFLVFSLYFKRLLPDIKGQTVSSLVCMDVGVYTMSTFGLTQLFFPTEHTTVIEYISLYMLVPLMILLIYQIQELHFRRFFRITIVIGFAYLIFAIIMHFTNIAHLPYFRLGCFIFVIFMVGTLFYINISYLRSGNADSMSKLQIASPTLLCTCAIIGIVLYTFTNYSEHAWQNEFPMLMCSFGGYLFAVMRFMIYLVMTQMMKPQQIEYLLLSRKAYVDALTGLSNRARITEAMEELDKADDVYCLISLDLNDLKLANDTLGHAVGDRLITAFATVLRDSFPEDAECCRSGGDEYMVIWKNTTKSQVDGCLKKVSEALKNLDKQDPKMKHSASWGYAFSLEFEHPDTHNVFLAAEERMYKHKVAYKDQKKILA